MLIDKTLVAKTVAYLEDYLDTGDLTQEEKGEILSVLNFWRLYFNMLQEVRRLMLEAFLKGIAATVGGLLAYTLYDGIYTLCAWVRSKRNPPQTSKRKKKNQERNMIEGFKWMLGACAGGLIFWIALIVLIYGAALGAVVVNAAWSGIKKLLKKFKKSLQKDQK